MSHDTPDHKLNMTSLSKQRQVQPTHMSVINWRVTVSGNNVRDSSDTMILGSLSPELLTKISQDPRIIYYNRQLAYYEKRMESIPPPQIPNLS